MRGQSQAQRLMTAGRERQAAELRVKGWTLQQIADEMGMSRSGVHDLLERYRVSLPAEALEAHRSMVIARLEWVHKLAAKDAEDKDEGIRDRAQKRVIRAAEALARVTGIVTTPLVQVNVGMSAEHQVDLSQLSIDEVKAWRKMQLKIARPAPVPVLEAHGVDVTEPKEDDDERADPGQEG